MKSIISVLFFLVSFSSFAQIQLETFHQGAPQNLINAFNSLRASNTKITAFQFTRQGEWILLAGKRRWYSNASYFQNLKGSGSRGLRQVLEPILNDANKHVDSVTIGEDGNWIILLRGGSMVHSSARHFQNNGLATKVAQIRNAGRRIVKVYLGPQNSWILGDHMGTLYTKGLPSDLTRLINSIRESKLRLGNINFSFKGDGKFHYVLTAGGHFWKSGKPGSPLWNALVRMQKNDNMISKVALQPNGSFSVVSQFKWRPSTGDILSRVEQAVGGMDIWERMRHHRVPGVSLALVRKGKIVDVRPYGWRRRDTWQTVNNQTIFSVASTSKAVGSAGIMKAAEEGKINLDSSVFSAINSNTNLTITRNWYRSLTERERDFVREAPFHSLLNHTSGLGVHGIGLYEPNNLPSLLDIIMGTGSREKVEPQWIPLTRYQYSGGAFSVAESITEQTYGKSFADYMREKILQPAGMTNSTFGELSATARTNYAYGHKNNERLAYKICPGKAAGGLFTNAHDYGKFLATLMNQGKAPNGQQVLSPSSIRKMMTPGHAKSSALNACVQNSECSTADGEACYFGKCLKPILNGSRHTGLGMQLHPTRLSNGLPATIRHGGTQEGYRAWFDANLNVDYGIVILTNGDCEWKVTLPDGTEEKRGGCSLTTEIKNSFYNIVL